jgi:hypothetical protein
MSKEIEIVWLRLASVREPADYFTTNVSDGIRVRSTSHLWAGASGVQQLWGSNVVRVFSNLDNVVLLLT